MQNCFENCKTGVHRVSPVGVKPVKTEISDAPPDVNGVADFCGYCTKHDRCARRSCSRCAPHCPTPVNVPPSLAPPPHPKI